MATPAPTAADYAALLQYTQSMVQLFTTHAHAHARARTHANFSGKA
jgi:hypothetical protein